MDRHPRYGQRKRGPSRVGTQLRTFSTPSSFPWIEPQQSVSFGSFASTAAAPTCACTTFGCVLPSTFLGGGASRVFPLVLAPATFPPSAHLCTAPFGGGDVCASCHAAGDGGGGRHGCCGGAGCAMDETCTNRRLSSFSPLEETRLKGGIGRV